MSIGASLTEATVERRPNRDTYRRSPSRSSRPGGLPRTARPLHGVADGVAVAIVRAMPSAPLSLIEFPADDPERARRFWAGLLDVSLDSRRKGEGQGWQTHSEAPALGVHQRGRGPGDTFSLPYFAVADLSESLERVRALGGTVVHPGARWAVCRDSEGSPFGLALAESGRAR